MAIVLEPPLRLLHSTRDGDYLRALSDFALGLDVASVRRAVDATGRIELEKHPSFPWVGGALLVAEHLIVTARHVADLFLLRDAGQWVLDPRYRVRVTFGDRLGEVPVSDVARCVLHHPVLDLVVLELAAPATPAPLVLDGTAASAEQGEALAAIGFYSEDPRNDPKQFRQLGTFQQAEKLIAPGKVTGHGPHAGEGRGVWSIMHDATTVGGAAGGPLVSLRSGGAIGIHFAGQFARANYAVPASEMALDARLRELGIAFAAGSPDPDPDAFEAEYAHEASEAGSSAGSTGRPMPASATPAGNALPDTALDRIAQQLHDQFDSLDAAMSFLGGFGEDYQRTISAQPGRSVLPEDEYRIVVLQALNRRGLLTDDVNAVLFKQNSETDDNRILKDSLAPAAAVAIGAVRAFDDASAVNQTSAFDELAGLLDDSRNSEWDAFSIGSAYYERFVSEKGEVRPLADVVRTLAAQQSASSEAREALGWIVRHVLPLASIRDKLPAPTVETLQHFAQPTELSLDRLCRSPDPLEWVDMRFLARGIEAARSVGVVSWVGPRRAGSTGWLLAPDLVVAPAHLVGMSHWVKPKRLLSIADVDVTGHSVRFEGVEAGDPPIERSVAAVESLDHATDLMIIRLTEPLTDRAPLQMQLDRPTDVPVAAIQHPQLGAKVLSYAGGRMLGDDGDEIIYSLATGPGCAGAPIFTQDWKVLATHRGARNIAGSDGRPFSIRFGVSVDALVSRLRSGGDTAALWRKIVGAQDALRSIDPFLLALESGESRPSIIELVDERTELPVVEGLTFISRAGQSVIARLNAAACAELSRMPGVVAVEQSRSSARTELRNSLPAVGLPVDRAGIAETGDQAIVAIIDVGIDPFHEAFRGPDGKSRVDLYWDQRVDDATGAGLSRTFSSDAKDLVESYGLAGGTLYVGADLDDPGLLDFDTRKRLRRGVAHGTAVASIAAGRATGPHPQHFCGGVAPGARLIVVRFDGNETAMGSPAGYMSALDLIERRASELGLPVVVNISNGTSGGAHDGTSPVEIHCGRFVSRPWRVIVKSAGNERNKNRHAQFRFDQEGLKTLRWRSLPTTNPARPGGVDELEIWCSSYNRYRFELEDPERGRFPLPIGGHSRERLNTGNDLECSYEIFSADNRKKSRVVLRIYPGAKQAVQSGEWRLHIRPLPFRSPDTLHGWLTEQNDRDLTFMYDTERNCTITLPGTGDQTITVAAMHSNDEMQVLEDGSMGPNSDGFMKPDIIAPGVNLVAAQAGTEKDATHNGESGTSYAAPHVAGAVALALSMARKAADEPATEAPARQLDQALVRELLVLSAPNFNARGSVEAGYGRLDVPGFLQEIRNYLGLT